MGAAFNWYLDSWKRYAQFSGRSQRAAYWYFVLFNLIAAFIAGLLDSLLGSYTATGTGIIATLYSLATLVPGLAVSVRRVHDTGRPGTKLWWGVLPIVGWYLVIKWLAEDGQPGQNAFGPDPKSSPMTVSA